MTDAASRGFLVLVCHLSTPFNPRCIAWFPSVSVSFGYSLNFDLVTDSASRGFLVLACHLAGRCIARLTNVSVLVWLHLVTDAASRGFLVLACHLAGRCIALFTSVSVSFGYTL